MYKDREKSACESEYEFVTCHEHVELEKISESDLNSRIQNKPKKLIPQIEPHTPTPKLRRSEKESKLTEHWSPSLHYLLLSNGGEPKSYDEALQVGDSIKWESVMQDEMDSLMANQTWEFTKLLVGKKVLHNKWVYRVKQEHDGSKCYKARLVANGFQQKEEVDYTEISSPVVNLTTIRLVLGIVAAEDMHLEQIDVKTTFLHGDLKGEIYMKQPQDFLACGKEEFVGTQTIKESSTHAGLPLKKAQHKLKQN